jgi:hypothetical protein
MLNIEWRPHAVYFHLRTQSLVEHEFNPSAAEAAARPGVSKPRDPVCSPGKWLVVPDRANVTGNVRTGNLCCNGERVVLPLTGRFAPDFEGHVPRQVGVDSPVSGGS